MEASAFIKKENGVETTKICRWCLSSCDALEPLVNDEAGQYKLQKLFDCTGFQANSLPEIPPFLCTKCESRLDKMYTFRWRCNKNIALVNGFTEKQNSAKNEADITKDNRSHSAEQTLGTELSIKTEVTTPDAAHDLPLIQRSCTAPQVNGTIECCGNQPDDLFEAEENSIAIKLENEDVDNSQTNPSELICQAREDPPVTTDTCINDSASESIRNGIAAIDAGKNLKVGRKRKNDQEKTLHPLRSYNLRSHQRVNDINRNALRKSNRNKEKHQHHHTDEKPFVCKICKKAFKSRNNLAQHKKIHNKDEHQQCPHCPSKFAQLSALKVHVRIHTGEKPFACKICSKAFNTSSNLAQHKKIHNKDEYQQCPHCPSKFARLSALKVHVRIHTGEKPFACKICRRAFNTSSNLAQHKKIHNKDEYKQCPHCPSKFALLSTLKDHVRIHTGEKPFACKICRRAFNKSSNLAQHKKIHNKDEYQQCPHCPSKFAQLSTLKDHVRIHTGEKPFACKICRRAFHSKHALSYHSKTHKKNQ